MICNTGADSAVQSFLNFDLLMDGLVYNRHFEFILPRSFSDLLMDGLVYNRHFEFILPRSFSVFLDILAVRIFFLSWLSASFQSILAVLAVRFF